jgi:hypothetical protein
LELEESSRLTTLLDRAEDFFLNTFHYCTYRGYFYWIITQPPRVAYSHLGERYRKKEEKKWKNAEKEEEDKG